MYPRGDADVLPIPARSPSYVISGLGLLYLVLWVWYGYTFDYTASSSLILAEPLVLIIKVLETSVLVSMASSLVYAGYWYATGQYTTQQQLWGAIWTVIGSTGIIAVVLVLNAHQMIEGLAITPQLLAEEILLGAAGGGFAGLLIGIGASKSMYKSDQVVKQRDAFAFLNKLLRHNLLNGINVIHGTVDRVMNTTSADAHDHLDTIKDRSRSIADLARNVRQMAGALSGETDLEPIALTDVLRSEIETARSSFPDAEFKASLPDTAIVLANPALHGVFDNLLTNAVEHNDAATPHVEITVDSVGAGVRVEIADNGPGIADDQKESVFEPNGRGNHGMGLFLVKTIITAFDGDIDVKDNEPTGTVFAVTLPRPE